MMKALSLSLSGAALMILVAGCGPELAQVNYGPDEAEWRDFVGQSYSGYRPPRTTAPAEVDKYSNGASETAGTAGGAFNDPNAIPAAPADDAVVVEQENVTIVEEATAAPAADKPAVEKTEDAPAAAAPAADQPAAEKAEVAPATAAPAADQPAVEKTEGAPAAVNAETVGEGSYYVVKPGDTLSGIAKKFYHDGRKADLIMKANSKVIKNVNHLRPGMKLYIPQM